MATHVEDLPEELLLQILDLLPESDLIEAVPYVCLRWWRLSLDCQLWRNRTCNVWWDSDSAAMKFFSKKPALRSVEFLRGVGGAVLRNLASHCPTITSLNFHCAQRLRLCTLRAITRNCHQIRDLCVHSEVLSCRRRAREVALMPRLETLSVYGCQPLQLRELGAGCARLRRLDLGMAADVSLGDLGAPLLRRLQVLSISWNSVSRDIVHCAESLEKLKLENYELCARPDSALAEDLLPLKALTELDARYLSGRPPLVRALMQPLLRSLTLGYCPKLDDGLLLQLCRHCPLLEDLDLSGCGLITARGLSSMWRLRRLRRLCLNQCESLGSGAVTHLTRCDGLQVLNMEDVKMDCMEPGVSKLLELTKLRVLTFNAWSAKDLIPWEMLGKAFPDLRVLQLGEWMSLDTTLPESLKAAMSTVDVTWFLTWELAENLDVDPGDENGDPDLEEEECENSLAQPENEEPDLDLFIFQED